jgi:hypothetical protein
MSRQTTDAAARPNSGPRKDGQPQWTDAEKAAFEVAQERAFRNFNKYFAGDANPKSRRRFTCKVLEMSDESHEKTDNFGTKMVSTVKVELTGPGVAGIRFIKDVTDNPDTIKNPDSAINHLYAACTGITPPNAGVFTWDTADIIGKECEAIIERGKDRNDGKRGGLWSELKDFAPIFVAPTFEDEDEAPAPAPTPAARKASATRKKLLETPAPAEDPELDDEVPF